MRSKNIDQSSAFNSRQSQSLENACNPLYEAVTKNLNNQLCEEHQANYEYYYQNQLLCDQCFKRLLNVEKRKLSTEQYQKYQYFYHLRNIMNHPLILLAKQQTLMQCPNALLELILKSYKPIFTRKSDLTIQRHLLDLFIQRIKSKINMLCDTLTANFERAQQNLVKIGEYREEMKHISKMYQQQFEQLLAQRYRLGDKQELQQILSEYYESNQNPFDKIFNNFDEVMSHLSQAPIINTEQLVNLYTTITDDRLWKCNKIISSKSSREQMENTQLMILNSEQIILQNEYLLQMTQNSSLVLKKAQHQLGRLDVHFDSLYHLSKYRLIGINYESIQIIDYFDRLNTCMIFNIEGCTDILSFQNDIVVISNQTLIKIDLNSKRQTVLGNNFKDLRYDNKNPSFFICEDSEGNKLKWNIKSSQPQRKF